MEGPRAEMAGGLVWGEPAISESPRPGPWQRDHRGDTDTGGSHPGRREEVALRASPSHRTSASCQCLVMARLTWKPLSQLLGQPPLYGKHSSGSARKECGGQWDKDQPRWWGGVGEQVLLCGQMGLK